MPEMSFFLINLVPIFGSLIASTLCNVSMIMHYNVF